MVKVRAFSDVLLVVLRMLERVVALNLTCTTHLLGVSKLAKGGFGRVAAGVRVVGDGTAFDRTMHVGSVAVNQAMAGSRMPNEIEKPFFGRLSMNELECRFTRLNA